MKYSVNTMECTKAKPQGFFPLYPNLSHNTDSINLKQNNSIIVIQWRAILKELIQNVALQLGQYFPIETQLYCVYTRVHHGIHKKANHTYKKKNDVISLDFSILKLLSFVFFGIGVVLP